LLLAYGFYTLRDPATTVFEFRHPVAGATPALLGISTLLLVPAALPYSRHLAWALAAAGLAWHLTFASWHTGTLWQGSRQSADTAPTLYLPTVAGNFTAAAALGSLAQTGWSWLFLGAGVFSWHALEPLIIGRLWHSDPLPIEQRSLIGIQFAPPVVCSAAVLAIDPGSSETWLLMLLGYGLFELLIGLRLKTWLGSQAFAHSWWTYSFGVASAAITCLKLALAGLPVAQTLALPMFMVANLFIGYLCVRSAHLVAAAWLAPMLGRS
jgi:tellurite resistance protein